MQGKSSSLRTRIVDREVMKWNLREAARRHAQVSRRAVPRAEAQGSSRGR